MFQVAVIALPLAYDLIKTVLAFGGASVSVYKVIQWIKDIREKDLHEIKTGMTGVQTEMSKQTEALVAELKEQRADFRTFYAPLLQAVATPVVARPRAKRSPRSRARKKK